ncbi:hypothetical protein V2J09_010859, partial [Rumex salicifolius]
SSSAALRRLLPPLSLYRSTQTLRIVVTSTVSSSALISCQSELVRFLVDIVSKMPFPIKMSLQSEGIKLQAFSKDLVPGTEGIIVSIHRKKRNHEGSDKEGEKKKSKYINKIAKTLIKLFNRQWSEEKELQNICLERKAKLEKTFKLESVVIHSINSSEAVRIDKLKILEAEHRQKLQELESEMSNRLNDMKARHCAEREAEEKEGFRKMNDLKSWTVNGLFDNLHTEVVPAKSSSLSGNNNLEKENINELGPVDVHLPLLQPPEPHNIVAETSGSVEVAAIPVDRERNVNSDNGDILNSQTTIQINDEVEQTATSKNDLLSAENPTLKTAADANEESTAATMEQHDEGSSSTHIESMNSPSSMNPSVVQPYLNMQQPQVDCVPVYQEHATSRAGLSNEDACAETPRNILLSSDHPDGMPCSTSEQVVHNHLPPEQHVPLDNTGVSHPVDLTQPCSYSSDVLVTPTFISYRTTTEAPNQEDHRPGSLPASQEFDPLQNEYERLRGESIQVSRSHEDLVSRLKSERDKEVEELVAQIRRKYESMVSEAEATFLQKKRELERYQFKVVMNMKLGEAFRCKCIDHRTTEPQHVVSHPFRRWLIPASPQNVNHSSSMTQSGRNVSTEVTTMTRPMPLPEQTSNGPATEELLMTDGVICLSDDE